MQVEKTIESNMTKFLATKNKPLNTDDLRLDALIKKGKDGQIVIVGCPFDFVRKRAISKGGQENGPCCIRRFYYKVGPLFNSEYQINISETKITDYGNINPSQDQLKSPQRVIMKIQTQLLTILHNNQLPFIFGGSKQSSLGSARAFHKHHPNGKHLVMAGMPFLSRAFDNDKLTSQNLMTILSNEFPNNQILFGPHQKYFPRQYTKNFKYISFYEIYQNNSGQQQQWELGYSTKPVRKLASVIKKDTQYHVTLSVQVIERFAGCRNLPLHGILPEQMTQIFYWMGKQQNIKSIDITEFNPSCEDYESSLILLNFLYHFLMGWTQRKQTAFSKQ